VRSGGRLFLKRKTLQGKEKEPQVEDESEEEDKEE
jgi:hypothetical protein